ncbi:unnamed protein product [Diplocarpon coronariae]
MLILNLPLTLCLNLFKLALQIRNTLAFLKEFILIIRTPKELKNYYRTFTYISNALISRLFLLRLPISLCNKIIKNFRINKQDPITFALFKEFSAFTLKSDLSKRTINAIE